MQKSIAAKPEEIFNEVYINFQQPVSYYAYDLLGDVEEARDITADAFLQVWKRQTHKSFNSVSEMSSYVFVCARHACFNRLALIRRRRRRQEEVLHRNNMLGPVEIGELPTETLEFVLVKAIQSLEVKYRESIELFYFENKTGTEISTLLELSEETIRYRLKRGKKLIREALHLK